MGKIKILNIGWFYKSPKKEFQPIKEYISFYASKAEKCIVNGELVKIIKAKKEILNQNVNKPGTILDDKLLISCKQDSVRPIIIQREGKNPLKLSEALNGWKVIPGDIIKSKL